MADMEDLGGLLATPNESPAVEFKSWLDFTDVEHRGLLAKAAMALANQGGGHLVLGFSDEGSVLRPVSRPAGLPPYDQDAINGVIKKFADPAFHCRLTQVAHPVTGVEHPVIVVPGGHGTPIMSRSATPKGTVVLHACYIRRPGPESAPASTSADWNSLLERCLRNRKADMLDAIRGILQGNLRAADVPLAPSAAALQDAFVEDARNKWNTLVAPLPASDPARFPLGRYEIDFRFEAAASGLSALLEAMTSASGTRFTGWPPFWLPERPEIAPQPVDGAVQCWLGLPETARLPGDAAHCDFWRVTPGAKAYLARGLQEDGLDGRTPGTLFDVTLPIWRTGEVLLYAGRLASAMGAAGELAFKVRWSGLQGRSLTFVTDWSRSTGGNHRAAQDAVEVSASIPLASIEDNLPEILHSLLRPLYETFTFFDLPDWLVSQELSKMRKKA